MVVDYFIGFGAAPAMWSNSLATGDGKNWDGPQALGAYTAALWYIGAPVPNTGEYWSVPLALGWPRIGVHELSEAAMALMIVKLRTVPE